MPGNGDREVDPLARLREIAGGGVSYEAIALEWIMIAATDPLVDRDRRVLSEEGYSALRAITEEYRDGQDGLSETERTELEQDFLAAERQIIDTDSGVIEKNQFLASLANMIEPTDDASSSEKRRVLIDLVPVLDLLVSLKQYSDSRHEDVRRGIIGDQFLGLWTVYKAGQGSAEV